MPMVVKAPNLVLRKVGLGVSKRLFHYSTGLYKYRSLYDISIDLLNFEQFLSRSYIGQSHQFVFLFYNREDIQGTRFKTQNYSHILVHFAEQTCDTS